MTENEKYAEMRKHYCETCPIGFDRCSATKPQNCPLINLDSEHEVAVAIAHLKVGNISRIHIDMAIKSLEEIQQYRAIGTIEEFKALKEKNTPYKPKEYEDRYYACKCGNPLLHKWDEYPTKLMPKSRGYAFCLNCGQAIDWSE